jgi:UPF0755 protein
MKRFLTFSLPALFLVVIVLFVCLWWRENSEPASLEEVETRFVIPKGWAAAKIGNSLYKNGLIKSPLAFKIYVQVTNKAKKLMPGEFTLSPNMGLTGVVRVLLEGPDELWVTVPEGLRREEIVERFVEGLNMDADQAVSFRKEFLHITRRDEGYLFPDTYLFPRDATAGMIVAKMKSVLDQQIDSEMESQISSSSYSFDEIITLASIVERETKTEDERSLVAGILIKRLENDWPLQVDASVQYAIGNVKCQMSNIKCDRWWAIPTKDDLEIESPYNSYKFAGLPPTPIANPGFSSIKAAIFPQHSSYWYYIHDPEGQIHFAETLTDHNRNIELYLK